jgi:hypothetical protein
MHAKQNGSSPFRRSRAAPRSNVNGGLAMTKTIAGLIGPTLAAIGLALLVRPGQFLGMADEIAESTALIFMSGVILLTLGVAIVRVHNVWTMGWPVLVTAFGWLAVLGGLMRLFLPRELSGYATGVLASTTPVMAAGVVALVLGAAFVFISFRAKA